MCPRPLVTLEDDSSTVFNLLNVQGTGYYIPLYQRQYRWTSENAERLLADILDGISGFSPTPRFITIPWNHHHPKKRI